MLGEINKHNQDFDLFQKYENYKSISQLCEFQSPDLHLTCDFYKTLCSLNTEPEFKQKFFFSNFFIVVCDNFTLLIKIDFKEISVKICVKCLFSNNSKLGNYEMIKRTEKNFKINSVNATKWNIQSCIKYQGLLNLQSLAEIKFQYNRAWCILQRFFTSL
ncbi:hypothetical protein BpHYR1_019321 [Brachionus plicatilis]|uniref:Uncharacterized protein n=1 Tax=Brachionus plicatilis TaxID=10195 RepID=A0A3M7PJT8_BRAPC|nr:hypothetical protein BpHYR1_019321 [Brachionus plicatilis]